MKNIFFAIAMMISMNGFSQVQFISKGRITFERKVNMWASITGDYADQFRKTVPQYKTDNFAYEFTPQKALYYPLPNENKKSFFDLPAADNTVFTDFATHQATSLKNIFEKTYLLTDSLRNAEWKIKDDFREIAGFNCRRATTVIMDSIFVVAFYTDEITVPGGPESFNGLPGTILGMVINRVHTTWYATKVELNVDESKIVPPAKGTKITIDALQTQLQKVFSTWGKEADRIKWVILI